MADRKGRRQFSFAEVVAFTAGAAVGTVLTAVQLSLHFNWLSVVAFWPGALLLLLVQRSRRRRQLATRASGPAKGPLGPGKPQRAKSRKEPRREPAAGGEVVDMESARRTHLKSRTGGKNLEPPG